MNTRHLFIFCIFLFCFAPHTMESPIWATALVVLFSGLSLRVILTGRPLLRRWMLNSLTLVFPALTAFHFKTLLGPEAASTLLVLLVSLKLHEVYSTRDEKVLLVLNLLVVMCWLLFSQNLLSTLYMLIALFLVGLAIMSIESPDRKLKKILIQSPLQLTLDVLVAVPLFLGLFFLFPRFSTPFGNLIAQQATETGFSENLTPGTWAQLVQSDEVAFRVIFANEPPRQSQLYWRGMTLENTDGWHWTPAQNLKNTISTRPPFTQGSQTIQRYEVILEPRFGRFVFVLDYPLKLQVNDPSGRLKPVWNEHTYKLNQKNYVRMSLSGESVLQPLQRAIKSDDQRSLLPPPSTVNSLSQRVVEFARQLYSPSPQKSADNILQYFKDNNFQYTTVTPEMPQLDNFLFQHKKGFCEHYASAVALLLRAMGHESRVVIGFQGGEWNTFGGYLTVRDRNAHAWSEVKTESGDWQRVDPTTVVSLSRIETGDLMTPLFGTFDRSHYFAQGLQKILSSIDSLNTRYIMFLLNYNQEGQLQFLQSLGLPQWDRKKIFYFMSSLLILFILVIFYFSARPKKRSDPLKEAYMLLIEKLKLFGIEKNKAEGPLTFKTKIQSAISDPKDFHKNAVENKLSIAALKSYLKALDEYIELAYGPPSSPQEAFLKNHQFLIKIKNLNKKLNYSKD